MGQSRGRTRPVQKGGRRPLALSFQDLILTLHRYWGAHGCVLLQPYDLEMGAGTFIRHVVRGRADRGRGLGQTCRDDRWPMQNPIVGIITK